MSVDAREAIERLRGVLGHPFRRPEALVDALTHRSYVNEADGRVIDNERLEFLGDAVVSLIVATELMQRYPEAREGALSRLRASLVDEAALTALAVKLDMGDALLLGRGEDLSGGRQRASILADAFEAVMAAVYLDGGLEAASRVLLPRLTFPEPSAIPRGDPKTALQERLQATRRATPVYRVVGEEGPDHQKTFAVEVVADGQVLGRASGRTKKEAERSAAAGVLAVIEAGGPAADALEGRGGLGALGATRGGQGSSGAAAAGPLGPPGQAPDEATARALDAPAEATPEATEPPTGDTPSRGSP
jgi:ribonuclease-3